MIFLLVGQSSNWLPMLFGGLVAISRHDGASLQQEVLQVLKKESKNELQLTLAPQKIAIQIKNENKNNSLLDVCEHQVLQIVVRSGVFDRRLSYSTVPFAVRPLFTLHGNQKLLLLRQISLVF